MRAYGVYIAILRGYGDFNSRGTRVYLPFESSMLYCKLVKINSVITE